MLVGTLLALALPAQALGPANTPWPMFRHDAQHTSSTTIPGTLFRNPKLLWSVTLNSSGDYSCCATGNEPFWPRYGPSIGPDGSVYATGYDRVWAINPDGTTKWVTPTYGALSQPAVSDDGKVYVSSQNSVVALSTDTGNTVWQLDPRQGGTPTAFPGGPVVIGRDGNLYVGDRSDRLLETLGTYAYSITPNGAVNWKRMECAGTGTGTPALSNDLATVFYKDRSFSCTDLQSVTAAGGAPILSQGSGSDYGAVSVDPDDTVYTYKGFSPRNLIRVNLLTGATSWTSAASFSGTPFAPAVSSAYVFVPNNDRFVALDKSNGSLAWTETGVVGPQVHPPLLLGTTLFYVNNGTLVNLDAASGSQRWRMDMTNIFVSGESPGAGGLAISTAGVVYALVWRQSTDRRLIAVGDSGAAAVAVTTSAWPSFEGNLWVATVTARFTDAVAGPAPGAIVLRQSWTPAPNTFMTVTEGSDPSGAQTTYAADSNGRVSLALKTDLSILAHSSWEAYSSTITLRPIGFPDVTVVQEDVRASTYTVALSTPFVEDYGSYFMRVTTLTFTVSNSTGGRVPGYPVALDYLSSNVSGLTQSISPAGNYSLTDSTGQARYVLRLRFPDWAADADEYEDFSATVRAYALGLAPQDLDVREIRTSSFTVAFSTPMIQPDVGFATMTVTAWDAAWSTVPYTMIGLSFIPQNKTFWFKDTNSDYGASGSCFRADAGLLAYTDASGQARFLVDLRRCANNRYDNYDDHVTSVPIVSLDIAPSTPTLSLESNLLDNFTVTVPTAVAVGISFSSTFTARNKYNHILPKYDANAGTHNLVPLISGTQVQGLGTLGTNSFTFPPPATTTGSYVIPNQTYNKIEAIQIKVVRPSDGKYGVSDNLDVLGPHHFNIAIPTGSAAGAVFSATITAVDQYNNQLAGYSGTLSLTPVVWNDTATAASGALSVTNVNIPSSGKVVINNEAYNKGGGIRIRAYDSALAVDGYSSSMTVTTPALTIDHYVITAPASVTVGLPFAMQINARDAANAPVTYSLNRSLNIQALLPPTMVAGSGSLGSSAATLVAGSTYVIVGAQTYNKIETIVLRATDEDAKTGDSANLSLTGPTFFDVGIPTAAQAGVNYQMTVVARDASSSTVTGYSGTVNLAAVQASNPSLSGAGTLGITSLNIAAGVGSTSFQTYTKAETVKLRVSDSGIGIVTVTSTNTAVRAGPPASLSLSANPQSTVASVPSVLTAAVLDLYSNAVQGATVTFSLQRGSGTVAAVIGALPSAVTSTDVVTGSNGQAQAFFASTNSVSSQADLLRAGIGGLMSDTTVYNAVLITSAGGTIVSLANPAVTVVVPANAYGASVRLSAQSQAELSAADVALSTTAFARSPNTFISTMTARFAAVLDSSPNSSPGDANQLVSLALPFTADASSNVLVGASLSGQSLLVPLSVLRVYRLNGATSLFEMVLDGANLADVATRKVTAQVKDPNGLYVLGAPSFTPLTSTSSGTVTTALASGATAEVIVPFGAFASATNLQLSVPAASGLPSLPARNAWSGTGLAVAINTTDGQQPVAPVTVNIGYKPADVAGLDVNLLRMVRYDAAAGWTMLESTVDPVSRKVSGVTSHFSIFMVVAAAPAGDLSAGIVYPSPFRPGAGHARIKFSRLPAGAHVKVFSVSGRLLKELDADAAGDILSWDGNDIDGKALPSGVYIAVVKSGGSMRKLKFAVQR